MSTIVATETATRRKPGVKDLPTNTTLEDVEIEKYVVPNVTINEVLAVIPCVPTFDVMGEY